MMNFSSAAFLWGEGGFDSFFVGGFVAPRPPRRRDDARAVMSAGGGGQPGRIRRWATFAVCPEARAWTAPEARASGLERERLGAQSRPRGFCF
jgi:hypothetical protein